MIVCAKVERPKWVHWPEYLVVAAEGSLRTPVDVESPGRIVPIV